MKKYLFRGGALLGISAILSKLVSFFRDRLLLDIFPTEKVDIVFAAFRIPDFFYYLFVCICFSILFSWSSGNDVRKSKPVSCFYCVDAYKIVCVPVRPAYCFVLVYNARTLSLPLCFLMTILKKACGTGIRFSSVSPIYCIFLSRYNTGPHITHTFLYLSAHF